VPVREITVDHWAIELDNGESLRDLNVGDAVDLHDMPGQFQGLWIAVKWDGDDRNVCTLQAAEATTDCAAIEAGCRFCGTRHAHPVNSEGQLLPRPTDPTA
jgi:hypothetical protein